MNEKNKIEVKINPSKRDLIKEQQKERESKLIEHFNVTFQYKLTFHSKVDSIYLQSMYMYLVLKLKNLLT